MTHGVADAARGYASRGWPIFPLHTPTPGAAACSCGERQCAAPGKHPRLANGFKAASADPDRVDLWWRRWPQANIGFVPGPRYVVLDVDGPRGRRSAVTLELDDVRTLTCMSGRTDGGVHLYFEHPGTPVSNRTLAPGIDVRGDAGYVILPPSLHVSGTRYQWLNARTPVQSLPLRIWTMMQRPPDSFVIEPARPFDSRDDDLAHLVRRIEAYFERLPAAIAEGGRNNTAYTVAAFLVRDLGLAQADAHRWLAGWNNTHCVPPLGARELWRVLVSASQHGRRPVGSGRERRVPKWERAIRAEQERERMRAGGRGA